MNREHEKAAHELEVFEAFLDKAPVDVDRSSIRNGNPNSGEPDIICRSSDGVMMGYELGRLVDPDLAKVVNRWEPRNAEYIRTSDPSAEIARRKLRKTYSVSFSVDLLLYKANPIITPDDVVIPTLSPVCNAKHNYARVWYMGDGIEVLYESS